MSEPVTPGPDVLADARAQDPVERLLEESWDSRSQGMSRRELVSESLAALLFLGGAIPLAMTSPAPDPLAAVVLGGLYAVFSRMTKFPIGAGSVVLSWVVLAPMLVLLPPGLVPLVAASSLLLGALTRVAARRANPEEVLLSVPDAWHVMGPALVLVLVGHHGSGPMSVLVAVPAFLAACVFDLASSTLREAGAFGIAPRLQLRVVAVVWLVDAATAPLGLLIAEAAHAQPLNALLVLPLNVLVLALVRDRSARIEQAQRRLKLVAHERTRLQDAVARLGEAFAAKLDLDALLDIVLRASIEALDADAGCLLLDVHGAPCWVESSDQRSDRALRAAAEAAAADERPMQTEHSELWALALPFGFGTDSADGRGAIAVARASRPFGGDEQALMADLIARAAQAAADIVHHEALRDQVLTDPLTQLGNRRKLTADLDLRLANATLRQPLAILLFDLDGFKNYNDTFGHLAGDALLTRLGTKLAAATATRGAAYRLGGDEFCVVLSTYADDDVQAMLEDACAALHEEGEGFSIGASFGAVLLPHEAANADHALQLADERMYARKHERATGARDQTHRVLMRILQAKEPNLQEHSSEVAELAVRIGRRLQMGADQLDELRRAAELHDVGKVGIPDAILDKPAALDEHEWEFMRQHTILGERILNAAPALRPVAALVRSSHERWDGGGYPDRLAGEEIPLGARIITVCDSYEAMTTERCYHRARSHQEACEELRREAGRQFDPAIVELFLSEIEQDHSTALGSGPSDASECAIDNVAAHLRVLLECQSEAPIGSTGSSSAIALAAESASDDLARVARPAAPSPIR